MNNTVVLDFKTINESRLNPTINVNKLTNTSRQLSKDLLSPALTTEEQDLALDHTAEPIKDINDINKVSQYLISQQRYRDNMLFILGINFGLRVSDLLSLKFSHLINDDFTFKTTFPILEKKTRNTRKVKRNRYISINDAVINAVTTYLAHVSSTTPKNLNDYLFVAESNRGKNLGKPLSRQAVDNILKEIASSLGLENKMSSHSLRKTFAYHQMLMSNNDPRKLLLLQKMFGHSTVIQTLDYIGITREEVEEAYLNFNLGLGSSYLIDSSIEEDNNSSNQNETLA